MINNIYNKNAVELMAEMKANEVKVDLTITSPPYDNLREYDGNENESEFKFKPMIEGLYDVTTTGGVVVWVVGDAVDKKGSETGNSFRQALYFQEIGFNIHDTMIFQKNSPAYPARKVGGNRYTQLFEYMFVFSKGRPKTVNLIRDKKNKWAGIGSYDGKVPPVDEYSARNNIWTFTTSKNKHKKYGKIIGQPSGHPAVFPEELAHDHILTWSNEGDLVFDPMCGSGTTLEMAKLLFRNYIGCDISDNYCKLAEARLG